MSKKIEQCVTLMRQLVTDIQGAPYPGEDFELELYRIWYEHAQKVAVECFEYMEEQFPGDREDFEKSIDKLLK